MSDRRPRRPAGAIGIEVSATAVRAARATGEDEDGDDLGTVAVDGRVEDALIALAARVGSHGRRAWIAWDDPEIAVEWFEVTGVGPAGVAARLRQLVAEGAGAVTVVEGPARWRRAIAVRWDGPAAERIVAAARAAGFVVAACEPAAVTRARAGLADAARAAAEAAAGAVPARPLRRLESAGEPAPRPWVIEPLPGTAPPGRE